MPRFDDGVVNSKLEKGDIILMGNPTQYGEILAENFLVEDITRANLQTLISASELVRGKCYRVTNAVGSTLSLIVQALTANTITDVAYNTINGDLYTYNITADTATQGIVSDVVDFDPQTAPAYLRGRVWYDSDTESLSYYDDISGTSNQIGKEEHVRVRNTTGVTITNGSVVYVSGATGQTPQITLAQANADGTSNVIGIVTHDISHNAFGKVTTFGIVNDVNTLAFAEGSILYLSQSVAGGLTSTRPSAPNFAVIVGICLHSHATQGKILVNTNKQGLGFGTANQLLGINAGATGQEYKTLTSSNTTIEITHTTNGIDLKKKQAISVTKAELDTLISGSLLIPYQTYLLTDATSQNISLLLTAKDNNELFTQCQIVGDNFDIMEYDYATDVFTGVDNLSCVARNTGGTWAFINDANHEPRNFASISQSATNFTVNYRRNDYNKVLSVLGVTDETYASIGFFVGASVGITGSIFELRINTSVYAYIAYNGSAWTVSGDGVTSATFNAGVLTINHSQIYNGFAISVTNRGLPYRCIVTNNSIGNTSTELSFVDVAGNVVNTADTNMKILFSRSVARRFNTSEAGISGSNIWITGQMMKEIV